MLPSLELQNLTLPQLEGKFLILQENLDFFFLCVMGTLISLMQIGFGYLEAGMVNAKNATNVMFKNMMDSLLCGFIFWLIGYTIAFGEGSSFMGIYYYQGGKDMFEKKQYAMFLFQLSYASTPSTITSGAVVDRISLLGYILYSTIISGVVYPIVCHWVWTPTGWLTVLGYKDFCGSSALHLVGGSCSIMAALIVGKRINRFPKPGTEHTGEEEIRFTHHNTLNSGFGGMLIYSGFFTFNGGSILHITKLEDGELFGKIMIITWLAAAGGAMGALLIARTGFVDGKPRWSLSCVLNCGLSGMASVCAHCDKMDIWAGFVAGLGVSIIFSTVMRLVRKFKIDDPIDVISVHFSGGFWGTVGVSMLRTDSFVGGYGYEGARFLAYELFGAIVIILWSWAWVILIFGSLRLLGMVRVDEEHELLGADVAKHGEVSYVGIFSCTCECYKEIQDEDFNNELNKRTQPKIIIDRSLPPAYSAVGAIALQDLGTEIQQGLNFRSQIASVDL